MTSAELETLSPFLVLAAIPVVLLALLAVYRHHLLTMILTLVGLALAALTLPLAASTAAPQITALLVLDRYAIFYIGLLLAATAAVVALSYGYLLAYDDHREEFYILLLLATLGSAVLVASDHFASFFLGLEILSVSLYALIAYPRRTPNHIEAGIKYLILAAASAAFLLFGMALIYAELGTMAFARLASLQSLITQGNGTLVLTGLAMMVIGIGFKLAVVPFHMWTPDVYEGAPAPAAAFVATVSKGGMFALLLRLFMQQDIQAYRAVFLMFALIAVASMVIGNLLALLQDNVKRLLAYSSIAHLGYLLVAFLASGPLAITAVTFYLVAYFVTTLAAFGSVTVLSSHERDADRLTDYRGLFWHHPWLAGIFTSALLSLAGIPLTAGFVGKFYVVISGVGSALWPLVLILVVSSAIGLFYYLRLVIAMYMQPLPETEVAVVIPSLSLAGSLALAVLTLLLVWLGVYPAPLLEMIHTTAVRLI